MFRLCKGESTSCSTHHKNTIKNKACQVEYYSEILVYLYLRGERDSFKDIATSNITVNLLKFTCHYVEKRFGATDELEAAAH